MPAVYVGYACLVAFATSFVLTLRMLLFQRVLTVDASGTTAGVVPKGPHDVVVFGRIQKRDLRQIDVLITVPETGNRLDTRPLRPNSGSSRFRTITRIARIDLETPAKLQVAVLNLTPASIRPSRLLLKRLLFARPGGKLILGVASPFPYGQFACLLGLNLISFCLLIAYS